jgi:phosphatidate cytidylyltransferase
MSDDLWRPGQDDDFGEFDDEEWDAIPAPLPQRERPGDASGPAISLANADFDELPHWTEPPTGEIPRLFADKDPTDDLDVWSNFAPSTPPVWSDEKPEPAWSDDPPEPVWRDDSSAGAGAGVATVDATQMNDFTEFEGLPRSAVTDEPPGEALFELDAEPPVVISTPAADPSASVSRGPMRVGTDPMSDAERVTPLRPRGQSGRGQRDEPSRARTGSRPSAGSSGPRPAAGTRPSPAASRGAKGRDMPMAIALGLGLALVFIGLVRFTRSTGVMAMVTIVMGLAAVEFYGRVTERGYRPATVPGIAACALLPVATYWRGEQAIAVVVFLALVATVITSIAAEGVESGPLPNTAITMLGVGWIGVMGSFAGLILRADHPHGTDTIFALAVGVVANDVGALFVGSAAGRTPLREWISPNKTVEGLVGGTVATLGAMFLLSVANGKAETWIQVADLLVLGLVIAVLAPIGDLTESMFKRNLDVKDFGTLLPGHGGVLDRFDGFLFVLPGAYYVLTWLEPWITTKV